MNASQGTGHPVGKSTGSIRHVYSKKWSFLALFVVILGLTYLILSGFGFVPNSTDLLGSDGSDSPLVGPAPATLQTSPLIVGPAAAFTQSAPVYDQSQGEVPLKVVIPTIGMSVSVSNPTSTNVDTLNQYLLSGAVRYPTSAKLGQQGNVILFGHSSYLPIVHNQAFKTFDGIQKLKQGDQITVYSSDRQYVYSVNTVQQESATADAIPLTTSGYTLTLATCDSFGQKTDRFVVTATLVGSYALGS